MKVKLFVGEHLATPGVMYFIDNLREGAIRYDPVPYLSDEGEPPIRGVVCHPDDEARVREAVEQNPELELVDERPFS